MFCFFFVVPVTAWRPTEQADPWSSRLSASYPSRLPADSVVPGFSPCKSEGHFCDARRNLRATVEHESSWAFHYLHDVSYPDMRDYLDLFDKLHDHVASLNERRGHECQNVESPGAFLDRTRLVNIDPYNFGKVVANYANAPEVGFKHVSDEMADAPAGSSERHTCSFRPGQAGWGDEFQELKRRIRGMDMFMWKFHKGRGAAEDKIAMVSEIPKKVVSPGMVLKWDVLYRRFTRRDEAHPNFYPHMTLRQQRVLPGLVRWSQTRKNRKFGLFSFGDCEGLPCTGSFFFKEIVKGGGIHGRNLSEGNPAERMQSFGMPWIGGVSGSVVDFYIAARALKYTGQELAVLVLLDIAALVAGGQHSMGELVWAAAVCELLDGLGVGRPGTPTHKDPQEKFRPFVDRDGAEWYFATPWMRDVISLSNLPPRRWRRLVKTVPEQSLFDLYVSATTEFVSRSRPFPFSWSKYVLDGGPASGRRALSKCTKLAGAHDFRLAVFARGGYSASGSDTGEEHTAWAHWATDDLGGLISPTLSAIEFVMNVASTLKASWLSMGEYHHHRIQKLLKALHVHKSPNIHWLRRRESQLTDLYVCLDSAAVNKAFGGKVGMVEEAEFKTFYRMVAQERGNVADDVEFQ